MVGSKIIRWALWLPLIGLLGGCTHAAKQTSEPVLLKEAGYIFEYHDDNYYREEPGALFNSLTTTSLRRLLKSLKPRPASTVHWIFTGAGKPHVMAFVYPGDTLRADSVRPVTYKQFRYLAVRYRNSRYFYYPTDSLYILTTDAKDMEKWLRGGWAPIDPVIRNRLQRIRNDEAFAYWYIHPQAIRAENYSPVSYPFIMQHAGDYWIWDVEAPAQHVYYGVGLTEDQRRHFGEVFQDLDPAPQNLGSYLEAYKPYTVLYVSSFPVFAKRWEEYKKASGYSRTDFRPERYKSTKAVAYLDRKSPVLVWQMTRPGTLFETEPAEIVEGYEIYRNPDSVRAGLFFRPLFPKAVYPYMAYAGNKVWMARSPQELIRLLKENEKLTPAPVPGALKNLHLVYAGHDRFMGLRGEENQIWQVFGMEAPAAKASARGTAGFKWQKNWPVAVTYGPQWIYNHRSRQNEILFQDKLNRLVLMDARGKLRWKKDVDEPVLGKIYQVDMFRNGKRQFLFGTPSGIYVMDIRGVYVKPFPLHVKLTQPFGLFDYDRNRHYRIAVPLADSVVMYDIKGQRVRGFRFDKLGAPLAYAPQHLRLHGKDYIFLHQTDGKLWILDRHGRKRIKVRDTIQPSGKPWAVYQGAFVNMDSQGRIVRLNTKGRKTYLYGGKTYADFLAGEGGLLVRKADGTLYLNGRAVDVPPASWTIEGVKHIGGKAVFWAYDAGNDRSVIIGRGKPRLIEGHVTDLSATGRPLGITDNGKIAAAP